MPSQLLWTDLILFCHYCALPLHQVVLLCGSQRCRHLAIQLFRVCLSKADLAVVQVYSPVALICRNLSSVLNVTKVFRCLMSTQLSYIESSLFFSISLALSQYFIQQTIVLCIKALPRRPIRTRIVYLSSLFRSQLIQSCPSFASRRSVSSSQDRFTVQTSHLVF